VNARARFAAAVSGRSALSRNPIVRGAACVIVLVAFLGSGASAALAAETHPFQGTLDTSGVTNGTCCFSGIAVDQSGGNLYLTDQFPPPNGNGAIHRFDNAGAFDTTLTAEELLSGPQDVAIDNSGTSSDGTVYVADSGHNQIVALDESGAYLGSFGTAGRIDGASSEPGTEDAVPAGGLANPDGLAVDPATGNLFVADQSHNRIWIFDSTGRYLDKISDASIVVPGGLAFDSTGENLYIRTGLSCYCNPHEASVVRFHRSSATEWDLAQVVSAANFETFQNFANDVAVDTATNHVYVDYGDRVREYDESGTAVNTFGQGHIFGSSSLAVDPESGTLYAAEGATVYTFGPLTTTTPPIPSIDPVDSGGVTASSAHLTGAVDPQGFETTYRFEYSTDHANWTSLGDQGPLAGTGAQPVEGEATGLQPHTEYFAHLLASNGSDEPVVSGEVAFTTEPVAPTVGDTFVESVDTTQATLNAKVNPGGAPTTFHFDYVTQAHFEAEGFTGATSTPETPLGAEDNALHVASATIAGLEPATTYRYRALATNPKGSAEGADHWLRTRSLPSGEPAPECPNEARRAEQHSTSLPDCRAYEMVSPPEKNGGDVDPDSQRTRAATDGGAVGFVSMSPFSESQSAAIGNEYVSTRSSSPEPGGNGWSTHAILPPLQAIPTRGALAEVDPKYVGEYSGDLSKGIVSLWGNVKGETGAEAEAVKDVTNLYLRSDLRSSGKGSYRLLSACPRCQEEGPGGALAPLPAVAQARSLQPYLAGASPDFAHVVFESKQDLTADAPPQPAGSFPFFCSPTTIPGRACRARTYDWHDGEVSLVGRVPTLPATECDDLTGPSCSSADVSVPGQGAGMTHIEARTPHVVSDGSDGHTRIFFTQPTGGSGETSDQLGPGPQQWGINDAYTGRIFMRVDDESTVQLNVSERSTPDVSQPAWFLDASADGHRAFFMTEEALTDNAPVDNQSKLYEYDTTKSPGSAHNLTLISVDSETSEPGVGHDVQGVIGISDDGHYVYFVSYGQLVAGAPILPQSAGVYLWHDGSIAFIGQSANGNGLAENVTAGINWLGNPLQARVTPDGRTLLFTSIKGVGLTGAAHGECFTGFGEGCRQLYLYSADSEALTCVSCPPDGATPKTMAEAVTATQAIAAHTGWHQNHALSADGRYVFFSTGDPLVPEDTNGVYDAYEYDSRSGEVHLLSSGTSKDNSYFMDASADGSDAFFTTRQQLSAWDVDGNVDLYDARIEGGFPEPAPVTAPCSGDSCRQAAPGAPAAAPTSSAGFSGPGNESRKPCPKGYRQVKRNGRSRCVKAKHRSHKRHTNHNRGAGR
jgi:NHL repeat